MKPLRMTSPSRYLTRAMAGAVIASVALVAGNQTAAFANAPAWHVVAELVPANLPPGGEGEIVVAVSNLGIVPAVGSESPVTITDTLPPGLRALAIAGEAKKGNELKCPTSQPASPPLTCTTTGTLYPYERIALTIRVQVEEPPETVTTLPNEVTVQGGGAQKTSSTQQLTINASPTQFGIEHLEVSPLNDDGAPATQAGAQPFQLTTTVVTNQTSEHQPLPQPKDLSFNLPPGLIGNPNAVSQCSEVDFAALVEQTNLCPPSSVVGVATVTAFEPISGIINKTVPVFNLVPAHGEPARFGFEVIGKIPIVIDTSVRSGRDYGVVATVRNTTQVAALQSSQVTLWGDPGDPRHNNSRGWECVAGGVFSQQIGKTCPTASQEPEKPFLRTPTSCEANPATEPVTSSVQADNWIEPDSFVSSEYTWMTGEGEPLGFDGCLALPFTPSITVSSEAHSAATPTGLSVKIRIPQLALLEPEKLAQADVRDSTAALPQGVELSPSAANGLQACSEEQIGYEGLDHETGVQQFSTAKPACPEASKIGVVHIKTPLLSHELEGSVYLASPAPKEESARNPFNSLIALYLVAEDPVSGVLVKLAGKGELNERTLQVVTTFSNTPQVPFEELSLELFGGPRGSVSTPTHCGGYATEAVFTPWSDTGAVNLYSPVEEFDVNSGVGGGRCPGMVLPFAPGLVAQSTNTAAGSYTHFELELSRPDGQQALSTVSLHLPPGNAAVLANLSLCSEAQAQADACPPESLVGEATADAGLGPEPYVQTGGRVYITGPYDGAPFGLEIVTPAIAGPFNLGNVTVRSRIYVDPNNASITIVSDPLPTQLKGIPLQLKRVLVNVNRENFEFNPTSCAPLTISGTIDGAEGASSDVATPFRVENCTSLPFAPVLSASANGHGSKADGTSFAVKVTSRGLGQANIAKVDLQLPKQLPSRLPTIQKACLASVFEANLAACDEGSLIGSATIHTPVLKNPLTGPAYLVSHGNAAFPDVEFVLQGEGIKLVLDGKTQIKDGITYSKFETAPDAPFTTFETVLPAGPHSALTANVAESKHFDLCGENLQMPTTIVGQNGAVIEHSTRIAIQGCAAVKASKTRRLTRAQKLAKALAACHRRFKHNTRGRQRCEQQARRKYSSTTDAHKHKTRSGKPKR
jgi:hypothetical protein